ncbi:DoxX family protein [Oceanibacterium hippocampi]|uniref:Putative oxidoreductase MhqP n=1 Tax=Oceanibacterium hippocampi TaxID=745714 RepID=A0A1Y5TEA9_9PROT|nr:DoxX family protein [Oceanibacterium hippocampi]SLN61770.1 Putative oxidoreductase MhqP [Oceanibacterium hippocampi]
MNSRTADLSAPRPIVPVLAPLWQGLAPLAPLLVRVVTGALLIPHGAQKLFGWFGGYGLEGTGQYFASIGFEPGIVFAALVGLLEFFGGIALILGLLTRPVAAAVVVFMAVAFTIHLPNGYAWNSAGFEMPLFWGLMALAVLFQGGGRFSLDRVIGREV